MHARPPREAVKSSAAPTQARGDLRAGGHGLGGGRMVALGPPGGQQLVCGGQVATERSIGPGQVVVEVMAAGAPSRGIASVVQAAEDVETLGVDVEVEDHHDEEVDQAEEQDRLADALQGPSQHQPRHGGGRGRLRAPPTATGMRSVSPWAWPPIPAGLYPGHCLATSHTHT